MKKVARNKPKTEDAIPNSVYTEAMPKTNTKLVVNPLSLLVQAAAPVTPKVIGINGQMQGEKLTRKPAKKLAPKPQIWLVVNIFSKLISVS